MNLIKESLLISSLFINSLMSSHFTILFMGQHHIFTNKSSSTFGTTMRLMIKVSVAMAFPISFIVRCPEGWFPWDNSCYRHESETVVDEDVGQDFCQNTYNANLIRPINWNKPISNISFGYFQILGSGIQSPTKK